MCRLLLQVFNFLFIIFFEGRVGVPVTGQNATITCVCVCVYIHLHVHACTLYVHACVIPSPSSYLIQVPNKAENLLIEKSLAKMKGQKYFNIELYFLLLICPSFFFCPFPFFFHWFNQTCSAIFFQDLDDTLLILTTLLIIYIFFWKIDPFQYYNRFE